MGAMLDPRVDEIPQELVIDEPASASDPGVKS